MGVDGVLRSNFADAMEIQDVRYINALTTEAFHDFQNTKPTIETAGTAVICFKLEKSSFLFG